MGRTISNWGGAPNPLSAGNNVSTYDDHTHDNGGQTASAQPSAAVFGHAPEQQPSAAVFGHAPEQQPSAAVFGHAPEQQPSAAVFGHAPEQQPSAPVFGHVTEQPVQPVEQSPRESIQDYPAPQNARTSLSNWSNEAEKLETGSWKMVQLDNTLDPIAYPLPKGMNSPPSLSSTLLGPRASNTSLPAVPKPQIPDQPVSPTTPWRVAQSAIPSLPVQKASAPLDFPIENFPQLLLGDMMTGEALVPAIQPQMRSENPFSLPAVQPVQPIQQEPVQPMQQGLVQPIQREPVQPIQQEPVQPMQQQPVQPMQQEPVQPIQQQPVQPMQQEPVQPIQQEPVQPMQQEPVQPIQQQPVQPIQSPLPIPQATQRISSIAKEDLLDLVMAQQEGKNENENVQLQNMGTSSTGGPRIYSVVSKRTSSIADTGPDRGATTVNPTFAPPEVQTSAGNAPDQGGKYLPPSQASPQNVAPNPVSSPIPVAPEQATQPSDVIDDPLSLFKLDDNAIDKIFSNNLGIHESVVPTQSSQPESLSTPIPSSPPPSTPQSNEPTIKAFIEPVNSSPAPIINPPEVIVDRPVTVSFPDVPMTEVQITPNQPAAPAMQSQTNSSPAKSNTDSEISSLFAVDDNLIDRIFTDTLGVPEHISKNVVGTPMNNKPAASAPIIPPVVSTEPTPGFAGQAPPPQPQVNGPNLVPQPLPDMAKNNAASFGQATPSNYSSGKQKISGVGKLDTRGETVTDPGSGRIASIGKFLLDNKDLEKIGKITASDLSDSKMRTLTVEANEELKNLLNQIDAQDGVTGTVIVGHDGLLIANTVTQEFDPESLGVWALGVYMGTAHVVEKLGDDNVRQIVSQTSQGYLIIANFGAGLLVTLTGPIMLDKLLPLMRTITQLVAA